LRRGADLSIVVLTKNEAARLPQTLARLPAGARIFVLDAESSDDTVAIARAHGAAVEVRPWAGFVDARRYALARVETAYAFMLDADERLDDPLRESLGTADLARFDGYRVARVTLLAGRVVHAAGWYDERLVRCFRTDRARVVPYSVGGGADLHERWVVDGTVGELAGTIVHDSYPTIASYFEKYGRYTRIEASSLRPSLWRAFRSLAAVPPRFAWLWLRYGAWRDGWRGVFVAWFSAAYPFVVQFRAFELAR
jgi:glycosyltransferase involved in cell wall biosynthesis